jgi:hypothetical protein
MLEEQAVLYAINFGMDLKPFYSYVYIYSMYFVLNHV